MKISHHRSVKKVMRKRDPFIKLFLWLIAGLPQIWLAQTGAFADSTADFNSGGLRIQLRSIHTGTNYALSISSSASTTNAIVPTVFTLDNPARIVVDIPGFPSRAAKTIDLSDGRFSAIRVGLHHDKTRLVLDVAGNKLPQYSVDSASANEVGVELNFADAPTDTEPGANDMVPFGEVSKEQAPPAEPIAPVVTELPKAELALPAPTEPEPKAPAEPAVLHAKLSAPEPEAKPVAIAPEAKPTPEKPKRKKPEAEVITMVGSERIEPAVSPKAEPPVEVIPPVPVQNTEPDQQLEEPTEPETRKGKHVKKTEPEEPSEDLSAEESVKVKTKPGAGPGKLSSFAFKITDRPGKYAVQINVDQLGDYKLTRPKGDLYELVLQNTRLSGPHLTFPQFPPDEFQGFQAIAAVQRGEDVVVRIFVDDEVKLSPYRTEGQLWVQLGN